jgi:uncharacterized membrane protein YfcA
VHLSAGGAALVAAAAFMAGLVNAVAGGGTLFTYPALLLAGFAPKVANITSTVALCSGYLGGSLGYRRELQAQKERLPATLLPAAVGAVGGSILLLVTPAGAFEAIVPFLILAACALLAAQNRLRRILERRGTGGALPGWALAPSVFGAAIYGGYFGAGLGIMLLAILGLALSDDLQRLNALKGLLSLVANVVAAVVFIVSGTVIWSAVLVMAVASFAGGHAGVAVARRLPPRVLRAVVIVFGVAVAVRLLIS